MKKINLFDLWPDIARLFTALFFLTSAHMKLFNSFFFVRSAALAVDWQFWLDSHFTLSWYRPVLEFLMPYSDIVAIVVILLHGIGGLLLFFNVRVRLGGLILLFAQLNILFATMNGWGFLVMVGSSIWLSLYYAAGPPCSERKWRWLSWAFILLLSLMVYGRYYRGDPWITSFPEHFTNLKVDAMGTHPMFKSWLIALSSGVAGPWMWASMWWIQCAIPFLLLTRYRLAAGALLLTIFLGRTMFWMNVMGAEGVLYVLVAYAWLAEGFRQERTRPPVRLFGIFADIRLFGRYVFAFLKRSFPPSIMRLLPVFAVAFFLSACASTPATPEKDPLPAGRTDIVMNEKGFSPASVEVTAGGTVCWINEHDGEARWPASNDHPTHEEYSEFDPRTPVRDGDHWCFAFAEPGTWKFHDHLFPEFVGTVVVR